MKRLFLAILALTLSIGGILSAQTLVNIGSGTAVNTTTGVPTPYGTYYKNFHQQFLILASELNDAGGGAGDITSIAFNVSNLNNCSPMPNYTIRLKHTTQTTLTTTFEVGDYTTVWTAPEFMPVTGWNVHNFTTPFNWDGASNLLVDIVTTLITGNYTQNASCYYSTTTFNSSLRYQSDSTDASSSATGTVSTNRSNMQFIMAPVVVTNPPNPAILVSPANGATLVSPSANLNWVSGGGAPSGFKLSLGTNNPPTNILNNQDLGLVTTYDPPQDFDLNTTYYWKVTPYNAMGDAVSCPVWSFTTHGEPIVNSLPYFQNFDLVIPPVLPFDWTSIVQAAVTTAYVDTYASTTYAHSQPNCVRLYNSSDASATVMLVAPVLGDALDPHTVRVRFWARSLSTGYNISLGVMTSQTNPATFQAVQNIALTTTITEYIVDLTTYTGNGRYITFKHGGGSSGTLYLDDISFELISPNDLAAFSITGNVTPSVGNATDYTIGLKNWGTASQSAYIVKLMSGDTELASAPGPTIAAGATATAVVTWTPTVEGPMSIYGKVVLTGDVNPLNDNSPSINISVMPAGAIVVTIGEGNLAEGVPWEFFYKNSLFQTLYYQAEIGVMGNITAVTFYNNFVTNLTDKPVKLWLGTTDLADLSAGWILNDLTLVYDGTLNFPNGENTIVVPLQTPYLYTGGNLVLYANRPMDTQYFSSSDNFKAQTVGSNRARKLVNDSVAYDPMNPSATGTLSGTFPKTSFTFVVTGMGSLSGTVTSSGSPLADVLIQVSDANYSYTRYTNAAGEYSFQYLPIGNYSATASKLGYETQSVTVTIIENQNTVQNFSLVSSSTVSVSGHIVGSDQPTVGIANAHIFLDGPLDYEGTSNANGDFTITGVLSGNTYNYTIQAIGYADLTGTVVVGSTNVNMGTLVMSELALPPVQIVAEENTAQTQVTLTWRPPGSTGTGVGLEDFELDDGGWVPSSNWTNPLGDFEWTNTYDVADWSPSYTGTNIVPPPTAHSGTGMWGTKINTNYTNSGGFNYLTKTFNFSTISNAQLSFWSWENVFGNFDYCQVAVNGTLVWGPSWDYTSTQWRQRVIDLSAYDGMSEVTIQFQMWASTVVNYAGWYIDDVYVGTAQTYIANSHLPVMPTALKGLSEMEAAKVANELSLQEPQRTVQSSDYSRTDNRVLNGYKVWRLISGNENNENSWTLLTANTITDTTFIDTGWGTLPDGNYRWAVKGVYTNNLLGPAGFSNLLIMLRNDMAANTISGSLTPTVGVATTYTIGIKNVGTQAKPAGSYTIKLMSGDTELASVPGPAINPNQVLDVPINWTPTEQGTMVIYGKVFLTGDTNSANDQTPTLTILVNPSGVFMITIGAGGQFARMPVDMYYRNSIYEGLYYPAEMGDFMGQITGIQFYNNFYTDLPNMPTKVWIGTTTLTSLSDAWIPVSELTLVFDGNINYPAGDNIITIPFNAPYFYLNGENLVIFVQRPWEGAYHNSSDDFHAQTDATYTGRSRRMYSDSVTYDPNNLPATGATVSGQFPKTTLIVIPGGVGHLEGTVVATGSIPLEGVAVNIATSTYSAVTDAQGHYHIANIIPDDYTVNFSKYGYISQSINITIEEDETEILNVTMQPMPTVSVTGTIVASDTGAGIAGASIYLVGYQNYNTTSSATGAFSFPAVYANQTYEYTIIATGYTTVTGTINVGATNYNMGSITMNEVAYAPFGVVAALNDIYTAVNISWQAPDPTAVDVTEGFEGTVFPPLQWTQIINNTGPEIIPGVLPTWCRFGTVNAGGNPINPPEGNYQAGLWWDYEHQDEWLITPTFNCPPMAYLTVDAYIYRGSIYDDHYYIKVSTDNGTNWTVLYDATAATGGWNYYVSPIYLNMEAYGGQQIKIAFQADDPPSNDGLWYGWFIDNLYIGNAVQGVKFAGSDLLPSRSKVAVEKVSSELVVAPYPSRDAIEGKRELPTVRIDKITTPTRSERSLQGYKVWRLTSGNEAIPDTWTLLTTELITTLATVDSAWTALPNGSYRWAVKAVYTANVTSVASFSNVLNKETQMGNIVGFVRKQNNQPIAGATVTAGGISATTNSAGAYSLALSIGTYSVTASAAGYQPRTIDGVVVLPNQNTTLNFVLDPVANEDEYLPAVSTELIGNYPNPFNPETTIAYSIKDRCKVRLEVYNLKGQLVRTLVNEEKANGHYKAVFNAKDEKGNTLSSGIYFYRLQAGNYISTRKMLLME
ncbi:carboxypeptidase regulatory-like domain-containing protein [Candidatus Cloacimonas acidaminovorans]|nr:carboxypeptidase regulatory-like domain-containing protein [Candidatus Cloacimonas acidaminovorans]